MTYMICTVGDEGIGPSTSVLSGQRSTTELVAHKLLTDLYIPLLKTSYILTE
jgi:hypothetical protein